MKLFFLAFALLTCATLQGQNASAKRQAAYDAYAVLVGGTWEIDAYFIEGDRLQQRFEVSYSEEKAFFETRTYHLADDGSYVLKSKGVRAWDNASQSFRFWEFGLDGSIVEGTIVLQGQNILHIYEYEGQILTDLYSFERDGLYEIIVGQKEGDSWPVLHANGGVKRL